MSATAMPVLVTGATGKQGGATARALRATGLPVRALVRDPASDRARAVAALGVELVTGDLHDREAVIRAAEGARAVFSVQTPLTAAGVDFTGEVAQGVNLIEGAKAAGVRQFVHTSVDGAGRHTETPGWAEGRWEFMKPTLNAKAELQDRLREAGFEHWTLLKPGLFMENFLPSAAFLFPRGVAGGLVTLLKPHTRLSLVAARDIGRAAAAAIVEPERFHRVELELASECLSMAEIAEVLSRALGTPLSAPDMTVEQATAAGMPPMGVAHEWINAVGMAGRPQHARDLGIPLTSFEQWAREHMRADA
ncbi:NmrA/HSCARG family protein [Saccharothrix coeruleofusca]|uniref:NmrA family transcriptional regulator n=1 Tax=Saccharothrix coeruleofusca TaxID=33919 RepID=A0A918EFT6_9PSEU|nr:NmrA/HSCARG family protein [Saccharothrix coeruleofusca]MBP2334945.1 uncharacterized protein YbjT (DUF2867 family) [Saccharothrix coeruleofusca]GGP68111.1 NmrA family transcriptional regulator [Saccharothrix coeruleofusca]